jgi:hypothetical protein
MQGLKLARQVLYHLSHIASPALTGNFVDWLIQTETTQSCLCGVTLLWLTVPAKQLRPTVKGHISHFLLCMYYDLFFPREGILGAVNNNWKNTKNTGLIFRTKTNSKIGLSQKLIWPHEPSHSVCLRIPLGDSSLLIFPSLCQQAGWGEPRALLSSLALPVTRHKELCLAYASPQSHAAHDVMEAGLFPLSTVHHLSRSNKQLICQFHLTFYDITN